MEISFNIDSLKINLSLYSDQRLNILKEKRDLDLFARKTRLHEAGWNTDSKVITRHFEFNYSDVLFDRTFRYVSTFEFVRNRQTDKTDSDIAFDTD